MLYLCVGKNHKERKKKVDELIEKMHTKRPDSQIIVLENISSDARQQLSQYTSTVGLFDNKIIVKGLDLQQDAECKKYILTHLDEIKTSDNGFIFSEQKLSVNDLKKYRELDIKIFDFDTTTPSVTNLFYLGDLLINQNKSKLWVSVQNELNRGVNIEEIVGIIIWQIKSLYLSKSFTLKESGLKPFVYNKCIQSKWSKEELSKINLDLIRIYHQSRRGGLDLQQELEKFILNL